MEQFKPGLTSLDSDLLHRTLQLCTQFP